MVLVSKTAWAGIIFILLTTGISGSRRTALTSGANLGEEVPAVGPPTDVTMIQEALRDRGHYLGKVDGVFGLQTRASIRAYQKIENLRVTGQLDNQTARKLGVKPEGRKEAGDETTEGKPSAGTKSDRKSQPLPKVVNRLPSTNGRAADRGKKLQAENDKHPQ